MTLLHVTKWAENHYIYFDANGLETSRRDNAEVFTDANLAVIVAGQVGGSVVEAFDKRDDWDPTDS